MSWMFKRDPVWKYLQTAQYGGVHGNFSRLSYPTFFPRFEFQDIIPPDDFLTSDEELDSVLFGTLRGHVVGLRYYTGVRGGERERETAPYWGSSPQPQHVPLTGIELKNLQSPGRCSVH
uniref:Helicase like transcription factor n=1 Tax=Myotis myotis TaxID=51298 RepID=A0A7J7ZW44_MYOMY|nr:helicase like transcription factor [Myotis myotis]